MIEDLKDAPVFLSVQDLIDLGIYSSRQAVHKARQKGTSPPEIYISERIIKFPKKLVLQWLEEKMTETKVDGE